MHIGVWSYDYNIRLGRNPVLVIGNVNPARARLVRPLLCLHHDDRTALVRHQPVPARPLPTAIIDQGLVHARRMNPAIDQAAPGVILRNRIRPVIEKIAGSRNSLEAFLNITNMSLTHSQFTDIWNESTLISFAATFFCINYSKRIEWKLLSQKLLL